MSYEISADYIAENLILAAGEKFNTTTTGYPIESLKLLNQYPEMDCRILRLKRSNCINANFKTIAIAVVSESEIFRDSFSWIAAVKEELVDPESADLYFVGAIKDGNISSELCTNIESGEQFCKKYIPEFKNQVQFTDSYLNICLV